MWTDPDEGPLLECIASIISSHRLSQTHQGSILKSLLWELLCSQRLWWCVVQPRPNIKPLSLFLAIDLHFSDLLICRSDVGRYVKCECKYFLCPGNILRLLSTKIFYCLFYVNYHRVKDVICLLLLTAHHWIRTTTQKQLALWNNNVLGTAHFCFSLFRHTHCSWLIIQFSIKGSDILVFRHGNETLAAPSLTNAGIVCVHLRPPPRLKSFQYKLHPHPLGPCFSGVMSIIWDINCDRLQHLPIKQGVAAAGGSL